MSSIGLAAIRRPRIALMIWAVAALVLAVEGLNFEDRVSDSSVSVPGSKSAQAQKVASKYFGAEATIPVLLEGPAPVVEQQGRSLARQLRDDPRLAVLSPWDSGASAVPELRPRPGAALLLVVARTKSTFTGTIGTEVRRIADRLTHAPVRTSVSGFSTISNDLKTTSLKATKTAERVAIPVLLIVLLLVFRSPIAALIPALFGAVSVLSGYGAMSLVTRLVDVTDVATALVTMMGLALGVDYSLLIVSRFREELALGRSPREAAEGAVARAGRTVLFAGVTLVVAMAVAMLLSPGDYLFSAALSVAVAAVLSVVSAFCAVPALLVMIGPGINKWRIGGPPRETGRWTELARTVVRRPAIAAAVALLPLLALAIPALNLDTGAPDVRALPDGTRVLSDTQRIERVLGEGWTAPFEVYVVNPGGPITTRSRLRAMSDWQRRLAGLPGVDTVVGPGSVADRKPALLNADRRVAQATRDARKSGRKIDRLGTGLGKARDGVSELRSGLYDARDAATQIGAGADRGGKGAGRLAGALLRARTGAVRFREGLTTAAAGAARLRRGAAAAPTGAARLARGVAAARDGARRIAGGAGRLGAGLRAGQDDVARLSSAAVGANEDARRLREALGSMTLGRADPTYRRALESAGRLSAFLDGRDPRTGALVDPAYTGLPDALNQAGAGLQTAGRATTRLRDGATRLAGGLTKVRGGLGRLQSGLLRLSSGAGELDDGLQRLRDGSAPLVDGLGRLTDGANRLADGLDRIENGTGQLTSGLDDGADRSAPIESGLATARRKTTDAATGQNQLDTVDRVQDRSPRLLESGYFVLAALDGSKPTARTQAGFGVNLDRGGQAARITIIPSSGANEAATQTLRDRLQREAPALARATDSNVYVGGVAAQVTDYQRTLGARLPVLIAALSVVTLLVLIVLLRAPVLAAISVALNLLTVGASFGIVALCFDGAPPLLGGPGYADILSLLAMFTIVFGLSLDYQIFILARMREALAVHPKLDDAIVHAISQTGRVVTGAAAIMGAVFVAFSFADLTIIRQTGIGLATAVLIDATLVRLVLLPATMKLAGRWTFWIPDWLDRRLPDLDIEGGLSAERQ